jgi:sulfonate transport system substrate-binding protein
MTKSTPRIKPTLIAVVAIGLLAAACSSGAASSAPTTTAQGSVTTSSIPAGAVLRVGEQLSNLKTVLAISGEGKNLPYQVDYSEFVGGPPMLQAFEGGSLDVGYIASTPLIYAQAAGQQLTAVAGWASKNSAYALVTSPGASSITGWASLKGKRVAYQAGTALESVVLEGLKSVGLGLGDITTVNVPSTEIAAALQGGSADAGIEVEPLLSAYLKANPTAEVVLHPSSITERAGFLIADGSALSKKATSSAIADYISRLVKAYAYLNTHPQAIISQVYVGQYGLTPARAAAVAAEIGLTSFFSLPGAIAGPQQTLADLYFSAGVVPSKVDVSQEFDRRFNSLVAAVQGS